MSETRLRTYLKASGFLLPASLFWVVARVLLLPKLEDNWMRAGATTLEAAWVMDTVQITMRYGGIVLAAVAVTILLTELRFSIYRGIVVGATVILINAAVLVGLTAMCASALIAVPNLR
jgi:hypothetical protein